MGDFAGLTRPRIVLKVLLNWRDRGLCNLDRGVGAYAYVTGDLGSCAEEAMVGGIRN